MLQLSCAQPESAAIVLYKTKQTLPVESPADKLDGQPALITVGKEGIFVCTSRSASTAFRTCQLPVDNLDWPPAAVALVQEGVVARCELVLLPEGTQGEQALQALIEVAKDGGQG